MHAPALPDTPENVKMTREMKEEDGKLFQNYMLKWVRQEIYPRTLNERIITKITFRKSNTIPYIPTGVKKHNPLDEVKENEYIPNQDEQSMEYSKGYQKYYMVNSIDKYQKMMATIETGSVVNDGKVNLGSDPIITDFPDIGHIYSCEVFSVEELYKNGDPSADYFANAYKNREGGLFKYIATTTNKHILNALKRCQIFDDIEKNAEHFNDCCMIYALRDAGIDNKILDNIISTRIIEDYLKATECKSLFEEFHLKGRIRDINKDKTVIIVNTGDEFTINMYKEHFFNEFDTGITATWLDAAINDPNIKIKPNYRLKGNRWTKDDNRTIPSSQLVKTLMDKGCFREMTFADAEHIPIKEKIPELKSLEYNEKYCVADVPKDKTRNVNVRNIFFADFETATNGDKHVPFMVVCQNYLDGLNKNVQVFTGEDCGLKLLNFLPEHAILYYHNLS